MDNLAADSGFCLQPRWGEDARQPGGAATNQPHCFNTAPIKQPQVQNLLLQTPWKKIKEASCPVSQMKGREMNREKEKSRN